MSKVDLVVIGNLLLDDLPHGQNIPGGAVLFTALAARCCGLSVAVHSVVGQDYPLHLLEEAGIKLSIHHLNGPGGRTLIRYTEHGRTLEHQGPDHRTLSPQTLHPFQARMLHIAPMPTDIQAFHLQGCQPQTALLDPYPYLDDRVWQHISPYQDRLAALLLNEEELHLNPEELKSHAWIIIKQGERGGTTLNPSLTWSAVTTPVVDRTGAGDAFAAGLASGILRNHSPSQALKDGALAASWVLTDIGAQGLIKRALSYSAP